MTTRRTFTLKKFLPALIILGMIAVILPSCSAANNPSLHMMPLEKMPPDVQAAPTRVHEAYQFSAANREVAESVPCYCGCADIGHTSSYDCYVDEAYEFGSVIFDEHALNCGICVDITQDVMRMMREGKSTPQIVNYINDTYSKYGSPTVR